MLVDRDDVQVTALKPAFQGDAVVVRLASFATAAVEVRLSCPAVPSERPPCAMRASASFATSKYAATA
jgi:alpha-mannosidase